MTSLNENKIKNIVKETINEYLKNIQEKYLFHATPSCYVNSIKKYGLGGKMPQKRFWNYENTPYDNITQGVFLATDEYVAESYLETSEAFEELAEIYEDRYNKELEIVVFKIKLSDLDISLLEIDNNQLIDDETDATYFYNGIIPYDKLQIINLY